MTSSLLRKCVVQLMIALLISPLLYAEPQVTAVQQAPASAAPAPTDQNAPPLESRPQAGSDSNGGQQPANAAPPVGTATAPYEKATGIAASRPAGAVIAPAKQRRARTILIRIGIVAGAAAAVGVVAALSRSSPSQAH